MMKTSSPPLTVQLCSDFFKISGTPAGWAVNREDTNTKIRFLYFHLNWLGLYRHRQETSGERTVYLVICGYLVCALTSQLSGLLFVLKKEINVN